MDGASSISRSSSPTRMGGADGARSRSSEDLTQPLLTPSLTIVKK